MTNGSDEVHLGDPVEYRPDRRYAWVAVILAMTLAVMSVATTLISRADANQRIDELDANRRIDELEANHRIDELETALSCRAESNATLQATGADAEAEAAELLIETAEQFDHVLRDEPTDPEALRKQIRETRSAADIHLVAVVQYTDAVKKCGNPDEGD